MAVTFRSSTTATTGGATATSLTVSMPAGVLANDNLIATFSVDGGNTATVTPPAGWTLLVGPTNQSTNNQLVTYWRLADGYEAASYTWTFDTARMASGAIAAYSGGYAYPPSGLLTSTNSASTSVVPNSATSTYSGLTLSLASMRNTTAQSSVTPGSGFNNRADACTTASPYLGVCILDSTRSLPIGGTSNTASTCSQSAGQAKHTIFLDDARPTFTGIGVDIMTAASTTASTTSTGLTGSYLKTSVPNSTIVALISVNKEPQTVSSITGGGLTWAFNTRVSLTTGGLEVWTAFAPTPVATFNPTITFSSAVVSANSCILVLQGADFTGTNGTSAIGAVASAAPATAAPTVNITTTRRNSLLLAIMNDPSTAGSVTPGTSQTAIRTQNDTTNATRSAIWWYNTTTLAAGATVTMNATTPSTDTCNIMAVEILAHPYHHLGASGAGT